MGQQEGRPNVHLCLCSACLQADFIDLQEVINRMDFLKPPEPASFLILGTLEVLLGVLCLAHKRI